MSHLLRSSSYFGIHANERSIYARQGTRGVCAVKTTQAVLLSLHDDSAVSSADCSYGTEKLADYLIAEVRWSGCWSGVGVVLVEWSACA